MQYLRILGMPFIILFLVAGCVRTPQWNEEKVATPTTSNVQEAPKGDTKLTGKVVWQGDRPKADPFSYQVAATNSNGAMKSGLFANPLLPKVEASNSGIDGVLLRLRRLDGQRLSFEETPIQILAKDRQLYVQQNDRLHNVGYAKVGQELQFDWAPGDYRENIFTRGIATYGVPLSLKGQTKPKRRLDKSGFLEITSAANHYWARSYVWILAEEIATLSDPTGKFEFQQLPAGEYELTAWMPNWNPGSKDYDPETSVIARMDYLPAVQQTKTIQITSGKEISIDFSFEAKQFLPSPPESNRK